MIHGSERPSCQVSLPSLHPLHHHYRVYAAGIHVIKARCPKGHTRYGEWFKVYTESNLLGFLTLLHINVYTCVSSACSI